MKDYDLLDRKYTEDNVIKMIWPRNYSGLFFYGDEAYYFKDAAGTPRLIHYSTVYPNIIFIGKFVKQDHDVVYIDVDKNAPVVRQEDGFYTVDDI